MDPGLRAAFNACWSPRLYHRILSDLERRVGTRVPFRVAESPLFLPKESWALFTRSAEEIMAQLSRVEFIEGQKQEVPPAYRTPGGDLLPQFAAIDFAVVQDERGRYVPRCVELQGFPSLYGFQMMLADIWGSAAAGMAGMPDRWNLYFSGLKRHLAMELLRETIVGDHDPEEVVLLDIDPATQKTSPDFFVIQRWFGVDPVCVTKVKREGKKLFREKGGRKVRIKRIYQRIVFDELEQKKIAMPWDLREAMDVEYAPRPDWFYIWSKSSLLKLDHPAVPKTRRLSDLRDLPTDLSRYVLKPLYSFAGAGVKIDVTPADIDAVPSAERGGWVLQEKVEYVPGLKSVEGHGVRAEVRMLFVRPDRHKKMTLIFDLVRLSRGKMIGVNFNRDLTWVGASVALR